MQLPTVLEQAFTKLGAGSHDMFTIIKD